MCVSLALNFSISLVFYAVFKVGDLLLWQIILLISTAALVSLSVIYRNNIESSSNVSYTIKLYLVSFILSLLNMFWIYKHAPLYLILILAFLMIFEAIISIVIVFRYKIMNALKKGFNKTHRTKKH